MLLTDFGDRYAEACRTSVLPGNVFVDEVETGSWPSPEALPRSTWIRG